MFMDFNTYWKLLLEIKENSDVEQYYDEMLRPLFKDVIQHINNVKVVPTYDTRNYRKENNKYDVITGSKENFVWADYIFVQAKYSHINPFKFLNHPLISILITLIYVTLKFQIPESNSLLFQKSPYQAKA